MGVTRDRVASGKKAAATNKMKSPTYYPEIGGEGGKAVPAVKRAFSTVSGLAKKAAIVRHTRSNEVRIEYILRTVVENTFLGSFNTREAARTVKRIYKTDKKVQTYITKYQYDYDRLKAGQLIYLDRNRAAELKRMSELGYIVQQKIT